MKLSKRTAQLLREKKPALGMWICLCDPGVAQIAALAGYDWVLIDNEHNAFTESQVQGLLHALDGRDTQSIVRARANREEHVKWILDSGAGGVMIPGIKNAAEARMAVEICKYHPIGKRGFGPCRVSGFWKYSEEYISEANNDVLLVCQVELASAVDEIDEICQIQGIDAIFIGPTDLAQSLGHLADAQHPEVKEAIDKVIKSANHHGKAWGIPAASIEDCKDYISRGGTLLTLGSDTGMIYSSASGSVDRFRQATK